MLGTPTEDNWPGISMSEELQNYHFPYYPAEPLVKRAPRLDSEGIDLVSKFLLYEARKRVSAREAMHHPYFASLGTGVHNLLDGKSTFFIAFPFPQWIHPKPCIHKNGITFSKTLRFCSPELKIQFLKIIR